MPDDRWLYMILLLAFHGLYCLVNITHVIQGLLHKIATLVILKEEDWHRRGEDFSSNPVII